MNPRIISAILCLTMTTVQNISAPCCGSKAVTERQNIGATGFIDQDALRTLPSLYKDAKQTNDTTSSAIGNIVLSAMTKDGQQAAALAAMVQREGTVGLDFVSKVLLRAPQFGNALGQLQTDFQTLDSNVAQQIFTAGQQFANPATKTIAIGAIHDVINIGQQTLTVSALTQTLAQKHSADITNAWSQLAASTDKSPEAILALLSTAQQTATEPTADNATTTSIASPISLDPALQLVQLLASEWENLKAWNKFTGLSQSTNDQLSNSLSAVKRILSELARKTTIAKTDDQNKDGQPAAAYFMDTHDINALRAIADPIPMFISDFFKAIDDANKSDPGDMSKALEIAQKYAIYNNYLSDPTNVSTAFTKMMIFLAGASGKVESFNDLSADASQLSSVISDMSRITTQDLTDFTQSDLYNTDVGQLLLAIVQDDHTQRAEHTKWIDKLSTKRTTAKTRLTPIFERTQAILDKTAPDPTAKLFAQWARSHALADVRATINQQLDGSNTHTFGSLLKTLNEKFTMEALKQPANFDQVTGKIVSQLASPDVNKVKNLFSNWFDATQESMTLQGNLRDTLALHLGVNPNDTDELVKQILWVPAELLLRPLLGCIVCAG